MTAHAIPVIDDVGLEDLERDPFPHFARWRRDSPVAFLPLLDGWTIARYDDCERVGKATSKTTSFNAHNAAFYGPNLISHLEGEDHRRMRLALDGVLSPRAVRRYIEQSARPVSRMYLDRLRARGGSADATAELLELVSVRVIGNVLGLDDADDATLQRWFHHLVDALANFGGDPETQRVSDVARAEAESYLRQRVEELTAAPDDSALSHMIHTGTPDGRPRSWEFVRPTILILIMGGFQEPGHAAAASLLGLLQNPDQLAAVRADQSLVPAAVHEGLRWISPFTTTERTLLEDIEVGGQVIPAGAELHLLIGSANRDEERHGHPEEFDVFRPRLPLASFGYGAHFCAGHFLGRELERIVLEETIDRLPGLRLDPERAPDVVGFTMRGVRELPVVWDA